MTARPRSRLAADTTTGRLTETARLAARLRTDILSGALAPGTPLREEAIAAEAGVSRHTVRAALAQLTAARLLTFEPYRGARVSQLGDADLIALQELRAALEAEAVELLRRRHGRHWPESVTTAIETAVEALAAADHAGAEWPTVARAHSRVHAAIVEAADSPRIAAAYAALDDEILLLLRHVRPHYEPGALATEHNAYVGSLPRRGAAAVRDHLAHSTDVIRAAR
ncbi:MAG TPA: GntR family transcriptional regulator [Phycicoccus sp.]|mgnify:CR=1 FL=1|nr:GntR family transcriptional regulator [Phycicoccus sp.]